MDLQSAQPLVTPLLDPALALRRQMLVAGLFKYVADVQEITRGYAFKFRRTALLARRIADYILFEGLNSPQLTFVLVIEPDGGGLWLQVIGPEEIQERIKSEYEPVRALFAPRV